MEIRTNLVKREIDIMNEFLTWKKKKKSKKQFLKTTPQGVYTQVWEK